MKLNWKGALAALILLLPAVQTLAMEYEEGTHYVELQIPINTRLDEGQIEVTEYFSYGCPHCYQFDPLISGWESQLSDDVVFNRTPAIWNDQYNVYAQIYYAVEAMDALDKLHLPIFEAIHQQQRTFLARDPDNRRKIVFNHLDFSRFVAEFGYDPVDFAKIYNSFGVRASKQQAEARGRAYRSEGVPALIVNGKYRIEGKMAGSNANMLRVADFLIEKERQALSAAE